MQPATLLPINYHNSNLVDKILKAIIWTNDDPVQWRIYASLGLNELRDGPIRHYIAYITAITSELVLIEGAVDLGHTGKQCGVCFDDFTEKKNIAGIGCYK